MTDPTSTIDILARHPDIQAILWLDHTGTVKHRRGQALSLRIQTDEEPPLKNSDPDTSQTNGEAIYITTFAEDGFLLIVFPDHIDFDTLKAEVDATLSGKQP